MTFLILGLVLWAAAHLFKRIAPGPRARLGDPAKGLVALALVASVALMVIGYRSAEFVYLWDPPRFLIHVNNLLMLGAVFLFTAEGVRAPIIGGMRHPQLTAVKIWATAHLLVNGDLASVILFGGLLAWAVVEVIVINRAQPVWTPKPVKPGANLKAVIGTVLGTAIIMAIHGWIGPHPWP